MSRIGKKPVVVPQGVTVHVNGWDVTVQGPKGELKFHAHPDVKVSVEEQEVIVQREHDGKDNRALHGLTRAIINNMVIGVNKGFEKRLEVRGVGYRFAVAGRKLTLSLGFSHPITYTLPEGISIGTDEENKNLMIITGMDKQLVGEVAAQIRAFREPEPYKGKGVRYHDEVIILKQGKAAAK